MESDSWLCPIIGSVVLGIAILSLSLLLCKMGMNKNAYH